MSVISEAMYWACADVLILAARLASSPDLPPPAELRSRITGALDRMVNEARAAGVPEPEIAEARYALVAFVDDRILRSSWPGRAEWMNQPLQLLLYREYTAGENFFARMRALLDHGGYPQALEIYYLCLGLGFRGAHEDTANVAESFLEGGRQYFARALPMDARLGPHAIPRDRARPEEKSGGLIVGVLAVCVLVMVVTLSVLGWLLHGAVSQAVQTLASAR
jgi:type VI secretion system protein ImpK